MNYCPECFSKNLIFCTEMIVCNNCFSVLKEHLIFEEYKNAYEPVSYKNDYDVERLNKLLAKISKEKGISFSNNFVIHSSDFIQQFSREFTRSDYNRKNLLSLSHIMRRFCEILKYPEYSSYFHVLKITKSRETADDIINSILRKMNIIL